MAKKYTVKDINKNGKIDGWEQGKYDAINQSATNMKDDYSMKMGKGYSMQMGHAEVDSPTNFKTRDAANISAMPMTHSDDPGKKKKENYLGTGKSFEELYPGTTGSRNIARYRLEKEGYDPNTEIYLHADAKAGQMGLTRDVPGLDNPNYNPGDRAVANLEQMFPNIKNTAYKSDLVNRAIRTTFGEGTSYFNKGFQQNKGNYYVYEDPKNRPNYDGGPNYLRFNKKNPNVNQITTKFRNQLQFHHDMLTKGVQSQPLSSKGTYKEIKGNMTGLSDLQKNLKQPTITSNKRRRRRRA